MTCSLRSRYDNALAAYDDLLTGKSVRVLVDQNGERIEYTPATASKLLGYITSLASSLGIDPLTGKPKTSTGPLRPFF